MRNLGGCGALVGFGGFLCGVLVYWTVVGQYQPPGVLETQARCLLLAVAVGFVATLAIIGQAPMGRGR